jgi:hypothetical protein
MSLHTFASKELSIPPEKATAKEEDEDEEELLFIVSNTASKSAFFRSLSNYNLYSKLLVSEIIWSYTTIA